MTTEATPTASLAPIAWYRTLGRAEWSLLVASNLGWLFDGYETYALILAVGAALRQLLAPAQLADAPTYAGAVIALTLLGWGVGGMIGGVLADYLGRKRTMLLAILGYSLTTGVSAFSWSWTSLAALRFLVGVAIGSEWVTGASIVSELWPDHARGRGVGLMQCGLGLGFFLASLVWLFVGGAGPNAWRYMFLLGVLPALLTLWVRRAVPESPLWQAVDQRRRQAVQRRRAGLPLGSTERTLARFTLFNLFHQREVRRRAALAFVISLATTVGFWGISTWVPPFVAAAAMRTARAGAAWAGYAGLAYNAGAVGGYVAFGFLADRWGRRQTTLIYLAGALALVPALFLWTRGLPALLVVAAALGWFAAGQYTWMSAWLPELFPTHVRATGAAFVFNGPRFVAWMGPLVAGRLIAAFGGFGQAALAIGSVYLLGLAAAPFLPETRGRPLPDEV
jgi:MFS family permease